MSRWRYVGVVLALSACAPSASQAPVVQPAPQPAVAAGSERPIPYPVVPPPAFRAAVDAGTRTTTGRPGPRYWENCGRLQHPRPADPRRASGWRGARASATTTARPIRSRAGDGPDAEHPRTRRRAHGAGGGDRRDAADAGGGARARSWRRRRASGPRYQVGGTKLFLFPGQPVMPGEAVDLALDWAFEAAPAGRGRAHGPQPGQPLLPRLLLPADGRLRRRRGLGRRPVPQPGRVLRGLRHLRREHRGAERLAGAGHGPADQRRPGARAGGARAAAHAPGRATASSTCWPQPTSTTPRAAAPAAPCAGSSTPTRYATWPTASPATSLWDATRHRPSETATTTAARTTRASTRSTAEPAVRWRNAARYAARRHRLPLALHRLSYPWPHTTRGGGRGHHRGRHGVPDVDADRRLQPWPPTPLCTRVIAHELGAHVGADDRQHRRAPLRLDGRGHHRLQRGAGERRLLPRHRPWLGERESYLRRRRPGRRARSCAASDYQYPGPAFVVASYYKPATALTRCVDCWATRPSCAPTATSSTAGRSGTRIPGTSATPSRTSAAATSTGSGAPGTTRPGPSTRPSAVSRRSGDTSTHHRGGPRQRPHARPPDHHPRQRRGPAPRGPGRHLAPGRPPGRRPGAGRSPSRAWRSTPSTSSPTRTAEQRVDEVADSGTIAVAGSG